MTASINTDYTFQYSEAQAILSDYDFDGNGQITYNDYWSYKGTKQSTIEFSAEEIKAWEVIFLIENEGELPSSSINETNATNFLNNQLGVPQDPSNAKTLNELQSMGKSLTSYIRNCTELVETFDEMLKVHQENLDNLAAQKKLVEARYQEKAAIVKQKEQDLKTTIKQAIDKNNQWAEEKQKRCDKIVEQCVVDYKNGKLDGTSLSAELSFRLYKDGFANGAFTGNNIYEIQACGNSIYNLCSDLASLTQDIRDINTQYNNEVSLFNVIKANRTSTIQLGQTATKLYESGYQRRLDMRNELYTKYHKTCTAKKKHNMNNEQLQMLKQFLNNGELKNMPLTDAWAVVKETFDDCGIELKDNGSMVVPKGHGTEAKAVYQEFINQMRDLFNIADVTRSGTDEDDEEDFATGETNVAMGSKAGDTKRNDPIGFVKDNISYNFIIDRDNNGKFDNQSEFLGAKKGWAEIKAFDLDKNGIIEEEELAGMQLLAIDNETGQYTFVNAKDAGVEAIDLNSYKASKKRQVNNNILAGTFNITVDGDIISGKQTYDSAKNLKNNFGMVYGSEIADLADDYRENPFAEEFVEEVNTNSLKTSTEAAITGTQSKIRQKTEETKRAINVNAATKANNAEIELSIQKKSAIEKEEAEKKKKEELEIKKKEEN